MSLLDARFEKRFDKRLVERFLRRGVITIESLNSHLETLEDCAALAYHPDDPSNHAVAHDSYDDEDDEDLTDDEDYEDEEDDEEEDD